MGSFASTCAVSNLPIEWGDPVRWLLVSRRHTRNSVNIDSCWEVRTLPLRAKYNDYGSIEEFDDPGNHVINSILEGLNIDLYEQGTGDNTVHDVAVRKGMSFEALLDALYEKRVLVHEREFEPVPIPDYIPTIDRISAIVGDGYHVDRLVDTSIRVRKDNYRDGLDDARRLISEAGFAVVETAGSGSSCTPCELRVFTAPAPGPQRCTSNHPGPSNLHQVAQMMVREDVWQALLTHTLEAWRGPRVGLERYREATRQVVQLVQEYNALGENPCISKWLPIENKLREIRCFTGFGDISDVAENNFASHIRRALLKPDATVERIVNDMAELMLVCHVLHQLRVTFRPFNHHGPQFGSWENHHRFHVAMAEIAKREVESRPSEE